MADKTSFTGKYAIVTGSTQGLGEAIRACLWNVGRQESLFVGGMPNEEQLLPPI